MAGSTIPAHATRVSSHLDTCGSNQEFGEHGWRTSAMPHPNQYRPSLPSRFVQLRTVCNSLDVVAWDVPVCSSACRSTGRCPSRPNPASAWMGRVRPVATAAYQSLASVNVVPAHHLARIFHLPMRSTEYAANSHTPLPLGTP